MVKLKFIQTLAVFFLATASVQAADLAEEPQVLNPKIDQKLIRSLKLDNSPKDWSDPVINILVVGQDGQLELPFPYIQRENGTQVKRLSSRADATILLSFNRNTGKTTLFSVERNNIDIASKNEILTHQYVLKGRKTYIRLVKERIQKTVVQLGLENEIMTADRQLHVHGLLELDFLAFRKMISNLRENILSSAQLAWALKGHAVELSSLMKEDNSILRKLRARQNFASASFQRSFNHVLFMNSLFGILSYTQVDSGEKNLFKFPVLIQSFEELSRTFTLQQFLSSLELLSSSGHMLDRNGFKNGVSPTDIYLLGVDTESYASFISGQLKVNVPARAANTIDQLMYQLSVEAGQFLKVKDCAACQ